MTKRQKPCLEYRDDEFMQNLQIGEHKAVYYTFLFFRIIVVLYVK